MGEVCRNEEYPGSGPRVRRAGERPKGALFCCLLTLAVALAPARVAAQSYPFAFTRLPSMTAQLEAPTAVAVDEAENVYVSEASRNRVVVIRPDGTHGGTLTDVDRPISLAVDPGGRLYVGNAGRGSVEVYGPELTLRFRLGAGAGEFGQPSSIAIDAGGAIYVADSKADLVKVYNPDGSPRFVIGASGPEGSTFRFPAALALNRSTGELVVADLQADATSGEGSQGARIQIFDLSGSLLRTFGAFGRGEGLMVKPLGVVTDGGGRILVTDAFQNVVQVFESTGIYLATLHDDGNPLRTPLGIAYSEHTGRLYVASLTRGRVDLFNIGPPTRLEALTVSLSGDGGGTVTSEPGGISCPGTCSASFRYGTVVTLLATPDSHSLFSGWGGECTGEGPCRPAMNRARSVTAQFRAAPAARPAPSDFNADGFSDILWIDPVNRRVSAWLLAPGLKTQNRELGPPPGRGGCWSAAADGNGTSDVLWRSKTDGALSLWLMDDARIAARRKIGIVRGLSWALAGFADFNGDGRADILWRNVASGEISLWLMDGARIAARRKIGIVRDPLREIAGVADFNGDGRTDILWRHARRGTLSIWLMNGTTRLANANLKASAPAAWQLAGTADFNGDGCADLLWRQPFDGRFLLWLMKGAARRSAKPLTPSPGLVWREIGVGDYNGDERADLLIRNGRNNEVRVCLVDGAGATKCIPLGTAPAAESGK